MKAIGPMIKTGMKAIGPMMICTTWMIWILPEERKRKRKERQERQG